MWKCGRNVSKTNSGETMNKKIHPTTDSTKQTQVTVQHNIPPPGSLAMLLIRTLGQNALSQKTLQHWTGRSFLKRKEIFQWPYMYAWSFCQKTSMDSKHPLSSRHGLLADSLTQYLACLVLIGVACCFLMAKVHLGCSFQPHRVFNLFPGSVGL